MSWTEYQRLIKRGNFQPDAWDSAAKGNPNNPLDACALAVANSDPRDVAALLIAASRYVRKANLKLGSP